MNHLPSRVHAAAGTPDPASRPPAHAGRLAVVYDGNCRLCVNGAQRLARLARPGAVTLISSRDGGALARFPQLTPEMVEIAVQLVMPDGSVRSGAAAIARVLETRPAWRLLTWPYRVPGLRWVIDRVYRLVADNRYRLGGRVDAGCEDGTCRVSK